MIYRYVNCRKLRGKFGVKKMADLRKVGCLKVPPFTQRGVDMFEPFTIRERKSDLKRFCALHIEVTINWLIYPGLKKIHCKKRSC